MQIVFDVESMAAPLAEAEQFKPEFTPDARLKDLEKVKADLVAKELAWFDKLALKAPTARILAIGYVEDEKDPVIIHDMPERDMLKKFWDAFREFGGYNFVGHNILDWDIPFLMRRSWILGVYVPFETMELGGRYLTRRFVDTMRTYACGDGSMISLDMLSRVLGFGKKNGEGKDFAGLYNNPETKQQALDYLTNDILLTRACANKMGIQ